MPPGQRTPTPTMPQAPPTPPGPAGLPALDLSGLSSGAGAVNTGASPPLLLFRVGPIQFGSAPLPDAVKQQVQDNAGIFSVDEAILEFYRWDFQRQQDFAKELFENKLIESPYDLTAAQKAWEDAVQAASNYYVAGNPMTPEEVLDNAAALKRAAGGEDQTKTSVNTAVTVMGEAEAKQLVKSIFQNGLGRAPSSDELSRFANQVVAASQEKASVTTMTQTPNSTGGVNTSTVSMPGYTSADATEAIQTQMERDPEYGVYQAATTYWNALEDL